MKRRSPVFWSLLLGGIFVVGTSTASAEGPGNSFQRWRWAWPNGNSHVVTQTVFGTVSHNSGGANEYAVDFGLPYLSTMVAVAQGQVVTATTNYLSSTGYGAHVVQVTTTGASETRYVLLGHMCLVVVSVNDNLYQGDYIGGSGNSGYTLDNFGNPPAVRCNASYPAGMHAHLMVSSGTPPSTTNTWQFGQVVDTQISNHSANSAYLPVSHSTESNNARVGSSSSSLGGSACSGTLANPDCWIQSAYIGYGGLNYGTTKALDSSTFTPCSTTSSRWLHSCTLGVSSGIAQTFEGPNGVQKALMRKSGSTSVYSVEGPALYAYHYVSAVLRFPTSAMASGQQNFENGYIVVTTTPTCQTKSYNASWILLQTHNGVC